MGSRQESLEDPMVYVAVGKDVKAEGHSILLWALQNSGGKRICILHLHMPAQLIPFMGARAPASSLDERIVSEHRDAQRKNMHEILDEYLTFCRQRGARAQKLVTEMDCIERGIVELITQHGIRNLVMGAAVEKHYKRKMDLRSDKAKYVSEHAPVSCDIQFICKGKLIFTREASAETETGLSNNRRSRCVSWGHNRDTSKIRQSNHLRSLSISQNNNRNSSGRSLLDLPFPKGTEELSSPKSMLDVEGNSDEKDGLSRSPPHLGCSTCSSRRGVDLTMTSLNEDENGLTFSAHSPALSYSRSSSTVKISSPSQQPSTPTWISVRSISACSSTRALSAMDGSPDINTLYVKLQQERAEAEKERLRHQKAERDLIEALCRAQEEFIQRKTEEALAKERELEEVKNQRNQLMEELRYSQEQKISLKSQIAELQKGRNELQVERDNALKEAEGLRRKQEGSMGDMPKFSEFSLSEIEEATQSFNESMKIGEGGYGNIYKGILRQTKVAIKRLHSQSTQGPSEFQMEVRVLSQLSHPNLVKLIGSCPEAFALIYEYVPNGSLEDRLCCRDNSPPLSWQTRVSVAKGLRSVLAYLHSTKPHSIIHGDLKPSNILLDANYGSKLSDFGICRIICHDRSSSGLNNTTLCHITVPKGTLPYIDPEFLQTGVLTFKSDVYSFGLILLQLLTGRPPFSIANEVEDSLDAGNLKALLDPLAGDWPIVVAQALARLGLRCCDRKRKSRPDFGSDVWKVLEPMNATCAAASSSPHAAGS